MEARLEATDPDSYPDKSPSALVAGSLRLVQQGLSLLASLGPPATTTSIEGVAGGGSEGAEGLLARLRALQTDLTRSSSSDALKQQVSLLCKRVCHGVLQAVRTEDGASLQASGLSQALDGVCALRRGLSR